MLLAHLPEEWRTLAAQQRRFGAEAQARILEYCADELWGLLRAAEDELVRGAIGAVVLVDTRRLADCFAATPDPRPSASIPGGTPPSDSS